MNPSKNIRVLTFLIALTFLLPLIALPVSAVDYRTGANAVSSSYQNGRYYRNLMQIPITGDGVTDVLAVALSQLGYQEGSSAGAYSGEGAGSSNFTEYYYNFGMATNTWSMEWCAAFVSWSLYQSKVSNQGKLSDWCRNHMGDGNYIWREISCPYWANQLKQVGRYQSRGSYTPKSGDLIFFNRSNAIGHIGIVVWCDGSTVYTIEGNTSSGTGIEANGGGVYYKSYALSNTGINGYGLLPYASNASAPKVDYTGNTFSAGLYMVKTGQSLSAGGFTIPAHHMFKVTSVSGSSATVEYNGQVGSAQLNKTKVLQISASGSSAVGGISVRESNVYNAMGDLAPKEVQNDPGVLVSGFEGSTNHYFGLEAYGVNKSLVLINGRSWDKWDEKSRKALERIWVYGNGDGSCYLGFDLNDRDALRLSTQTGDGEILHSIVLKQGFEIVAATGNFWGIDGAITNGSNYVSGVIGTLTAHVVLVAQEGGGFRVYMDGLENGNPISLFGYDITKTDDSVKIVPWNNDLLHAHHYATAYDGYYHWTECECGAVTEKNAHLYENDVCACGHPWPKTVNGTISCGGSDASPVTIQLFQEGTSTPIYTKVVPAGESSYSLEGVADSVYIMKVSKGNHATRVCTITVSKGGAVQDVALSLIGDVDGNGKITAIDKKIYFNHINQTDDFALEGYAFMVADVNGDGEVNAKDKKMIYNHMAQICMLW